MSAGTAKPSSVDTAAMRQQCKPQFDADIVEPLTPMEVALVATVAQWRDERMQQVRAMIAKIDAEAERRIGPVLDAHAIDGPGTQWDFRLDTMSGTGFSIGIKRAAAPAKPAPKKPMEKSADVVAITRATDKRTRRAAKRKAR